MNTKPASGGAYASASKPQSMRMPAREVATYATPRPRRVQRASVRGRLREAAPASGPAVLLDMLAEAAQRREDGAVVRIVGAQLDAVFLLDRHGELEHVERVEAQPLAEQRIDRVDLLGRDPFEVE